MRHFAAVLQQRELAFQTQAQAQAQARSKKAAVCFKVLAFWLGVARPRISEERS
jgi:hypothetical protein